MSFGFSQNQLQEQLSMNLSDKKLIVIKYGGNAMIKEQERKSLIKILANIHNHHDYKIVMIHGGGPFIQKSLAAAGISSSFFEGHRITGSDAITEVEKTLKGEVNAWLVSDFLSEGIKAVGLSGKDGGMVTTSPRKAQDENKHPVDLGWVGDVASVQPELLQLLLENDFLPIIACLGTDNSGNTYNINADMLAGAIAGSLKAHYYVLTDVDGLYKDINRPESKIDRLSLGELSQYASLFTGGMIPKIESCKMALTSGALSACILNGMKPEKIQKAIFDPENNIGTKIYPSND